MPCPRLSIRRLPACLTLIVTALGLTGCDVAAIGGADPATRAGTEIAVKAHHPAVIADIEAGGGPALTAAMDAARIPVQNRELMILRLKSELPLYRRSPAALVLALRANGA